MAYIDEGQGDPIVFQHGNPTSPTSGGTSCPIEGTGRLIACDLIGMGDSEKLKPSGPDRYSYEEQREFLFKLWDALGLGDRVVLVIHDWGSASVSTGQASTPIASRASPIWKHREPLSWEIAPGRSRDVFKAIRSPAGEQSMLQDNMFVERMLPGSVFAP